MRHHSLKLIVSSLLRKVLNNSFCTFIRLLFLPLAAQSSSAVNSRLLTFYTYFKFSLIVKQKRVENLLFFCFGSSSKARTCDILCFKLIVFFFAFRKVQNNSLCAFVLLTFVATGNIKTPQQLKPTLFAHVC